MSNMETFVFNVRANFQKVTDPKSGAFYYRINDSDKNLHGPFTLRTQGNETFIKNAQGVEISLNFLGNVTFFKLVM